MRKIILLAAILAGSLSLFATEASAVVCARGVYRAGCVGPRGAVIGHRGYYRGGAIYRRGAVVHGYRGGGVAVRRRTVIRRY